MNDLQRDPHNPVDVEWQIEDTKENIRKGVDIVTKYEAAAKKARAEFDHAFALAIGEATGPAVNHKYQATVATMKERRWAEDAEIAFRHAERKMHALDKELFAWQSILNSARAMFNTTGAR